MHWYTCKSLLNTLGRAIEQLAGYLPKQSKSQQLRSKYNSMQCQREGLKCVIPSEARLYPRSIDIFRRRRRRRQPEVGLKTSISQE